MVIHIVITLIGAALLSAVVWSWLGRTPRARWWVSTGSTRHLMLGIAPGFGVMVFGGGLLSTVQNLSADLFDTAALVVGIPVIAAIVLMLAGMFGLLPKWWGPKWYRDKVKKERKPPFYGW